MIRTVLLWMLVMMAPLAGAESEQGSGTLDAIYWDQQALVIGDIYYRVGVNTVFQDQNGKPMARSDLKLGDVLQYEAREHLKRLEVVFVKRVKASGR